MGSSPQVGSSKVEGEEAQPHPCVRSTKVEGGSGKDGEVGATTGRRGVPEQQGPSPSCLLPTHAPPRARCRVIACCFSGNITARNPDKQGGDLMVTITADNKHTVHIWRWMKPADKYCKVRHTAARRQPHCCQAKPHHTVHSILCTAHRAQRTVHALQTHHACGQELQGGVWAVHCHGLAWAVSCGGV